MEKLVPVYYYFNESDAKYAAISIFSLISNCDENRNYRIHILYSNLEKSTIELFENMKKKNVSVCLYDVNSKIIGLLNKFSTSSILTDNDVAPLLIQDNFLYNKAIFLNPYSIVLDDIAKLFDINISNKLIGLTRFEDQIIESQKINNKHYYSDRVMLINTKMWRDDNFLNKLIDLSFAEDKQYNSLNSLLNDGCENKVKKISNCFNLTTVSSQKTALGKQRIISYSSFDYSALENLLCFYYVINSPMYEEVKEATKDIDFKEVEIRYLNNKSKVNVKAIVKSLYKKSQAL